jgi:hypothetical protein
MVQLWDQWVARTRIIWRRLPKNLRSNRWWIVWNGRIYISKPAAAAVPGRPQDSALLGGSVAYVHWSRFLGNPSRISFDQRAIFIPELGRFGNMTLRLAKGLMIANILKIGHVVVPVSAEFESSILDAGVHSVSGQTSFWLFANQTSGTSEVLALHKTELIATPGLSRDRHATEIDAAWADLYAITTPKPTANATHPDHLMIHIRGGDVFGPRKPASYGQPPLSYYTLILDSRNWAEVTIVHGDTGSPILDPLIQACADRGIAVQLSTGLLPADLAVLLTGSTLVAGRGTFMPAVVGLSRNVSKVYFFHDKFSLDRPKDGIEVIKVRDAEGTYVRDVLSDNWENSDYQRNLMLTYPQSNLELGTLD